MKTREELETRLRVMSVIWLALTAGVVAFTAVVYGLLTRGGVELGGLDPEAVTLVAPVLLALMGAGLVGGHLLEARIDRSASVEEKLAGYLRARVIAMSTQEGPALAVIALSLIAGTPRWALGAGAVAVWTMFLARPRRAAVERLLRSTGEEEGRRRG